VPHPDYPTPTPADLSPALWLSAVGEHLQVGLSRNKKWQVRVSIPKPRLFHVRVTNRPDDPPTHPDAAGVDTPASRDLTRGAPPIAISADRVPENPFWKSIAPNPQLARVIATAIYRMAPLPWPS
jgi:hypothetical protein